MFEYTYTMKLISIALIIIVLYLLYRFIISILRNKRLEKYSINSKNTNNIESSIWKIIHYISNKTNRIFKIFAKKYDKYVSKENNINDGNDIVIIKIICSIISLTLYIFSSSINEINLDKYLILLSIIVPNFIPDILLHLEYNYKYEIIDDDILKVVIIMNNALKANCNINDVINNVIKRTSSPIKDEFIIIKNDIERGISLSNSFKRMYERTNIKSIFNISNTLSLLDNNINIVASFNDIEKQLIIESKEKNIIKKHEALTDLIKKLMYFIPMLIIILMMILDNSYFTFILSRKGMIADFIIVIIYMIYINLLNKIARR